MNNIAELEKLLREADCQALYEYEHGLADAPLIYKADGFLQTLSSKEPKLQEMIFVASEETEDRVGDVIAASGWDLGNFKKNPVWMFVHQYSVAPLGIVPKIWVEGKQLLNTVKWDDADDLARFIRGKYERGIMRAVSVGFRPLEFKERERKEENGQRRFGYHFTKQELLEISAVPVPMHPHALQKVMGAKGFSIVVPELVTEVEPRKRTVAVPTIGNLRLDEDDEHDDIIFSSGAVFQSYNVKAEWDTAYINDLPDSAFAVIEGGGKKDSEGKTVPRGKRHFPHHDKGGKVDLPHLRNALARAPQSPHGPKALPHLKRHAKAEGVGQEDGFTEAGEREGAEFFSTMEEEYEQKAGASISRANKAKIQQAIGILQEIVADDEPEEQNKEEAADSFNDEIYDALQEFKRALGVKSDGN